MSKSRGITRVSGKWDFRRASGHRANPTGPRIPRGTVTRNKGKPWFIRCGTNVNACNGIRGWRRKERKREREYWTKGVRLFRRGIRRALYTCMRELNEWRRRRKRERCERRGRGVVAWRFHYGDVSLRQTYAPNVVPAFAPYISLSRYFIFIRPA